MRYGFEKSLVKISGAPSTTEQQNQSADKPLLGRIAQGLAGTGIATANLRTAKTMGSPDAVLYHGTSPSSAAAIMGGGPDPSVTGLDTRFSGFADRLNSKMLANAFNRHLMDAGLQPSDDLLERMTTAAREEMDLARSRGIQGFDSIAAIERGATKVLMGEGIAPDKIEQLMQKARPAMQEAGKRIYMAQTPRVTAMYGTPKSELEMIQGRLDEMATDPVAAAKKNLTTMLNVFTGGVVPEVTQTLDKMKYERDVKGLTSKAQSTDDVKLLMQAIRDQDPNTVRQELRRLNPSLTDKTISDITNKMFAGDLGVTFGVRAKRDNLKSLSDFPMVSGLLSVNPGIKHELAGFLPTFDPVNDLSVPESIPLKDFRSVDLLDNRTGTPFLRLDLPNKSDPISMGERLRALKRASPYAGVGLLGADLAQDAIFQKGTLTGRGIKAGVNKIRSLYTSPQEKKAAFSPSTLEGLREAGSALKLMAVPTAAIGATSVGAAYGYGKASDFIEKKLRTPEMVAFKEKERKKLISQGKDPRTADSLASAAARNVVLNLVAYPAILGGAAVSTALANPNRAVRLLSGKATTKDYTGGMLTALAGGIAVPTAMGRSEQSRVGKDISDMNILAMPLKGSKVDTAIRDRPYLAGLVDYPAAIALPALGAYAGKKHYSGDYVAGLRNLKHMFYNDRPVEGTLFSNLRKFRQEAKERRENDAFYEQASSL